MSAWTRKGGFVRIRSVIPPYSDVFLPFCDVAAFGCAFPIRNGCSWQWSDEQSLTSTYAPLKSGPPQHQRQWDRMAFQSVDLETRTGGMGYSFVLIRLSPVGGFLLSMNPRFDRKSEKHLSEQKSYSLLMGGGRYGPKIPKLLNRLCSDSVTSGIVCICFSHWSQNVFFIFSCPSVLLP